VLLLDTLNYWLLLLLLLAWLGEELAIEILGALLSVSRIPSRDRPLALHYFFILRWGMLLIRLLTFSEGNLSYLL
jgi:hypothetical protein